MDLYKSPLSGDQVYEFVCLSLLLFGYLLVPSRPTAAAPDDPDWCLSLPSQASTLGRLGANVRITHTSLGAIVMICAESVLAIRTWAAWNMN